MTPTRGRHPDESLFFVAKFTKNTGELITWKVERVGGVMMTKKGRHFFAKNRVTPSVTAPGDTNLNDTTANFKKFLKFYAADNHFLECPRWLVVRLCFSRKPLNTVLPKQYHGTEGKQQRFFIRAPASSRRGVKRSNGMQKSDIMTKFLKFQCQSIY